MYLKSFTNWWFSLILLLAVVVSSCRKDQSETQNIQKKTLAAADSSVALTSPLSYLALHGTLTLKVQDSVYVFDASRDSVAFVNLSQGDDHYYGITAVNKAHTMSFAVSSKGLAASAITGGVEGGQLLFSPDVMHPRQYTLTQYTQPGDAGKLTLDIYKQDSVLAKGNFYTFLAEDDKANSPFYRVEGKFDLRAK